MAPIVRSLPSYVKDSQHALQIFPDFNFLGEDKLSYTNLFVGYIEHQFFNQYKGPKPELYHCYIDECVGATSSTREELNQFISAVNSFHPALKYTWEFSDTSLAFLDIKLSIEGNGLCTTVH